jgi:hypothetical protein
VVNAADALLFVAAKNVRPYKSNARIKHKMNFKMFPDIPDIRTPL